MSTRATYKIYSAYNETYTYFYIHSDNYPEGATQYFNNLLNLVNDITNQFGYSTLGEAFLIANSEYASFTASHNAHYDTEYRYDITKDKFSNTVTLTAKEVRKNRDSLDKHGDFKRTTKTFYQGTIEGFIEKYSNKEHLESITEKAMIQNITNILQANF